MAQQQPILVLGAGSWGTALALVLAQNQKAVWLWSHAIEHVQQMQTTRQNSHFLPNITFPDNLHIVSDLAQTVTQVRDILIVVPSHAFRETLIKIAPYLSNNARICWATKGLEYNTGLLLHQVAEAVLGNQYPLAVLSGPSFAKEVATQLPTAVTIASASPEYAKNVIQLFHNHYFRPYSSDDLIGTQIGGAAKNVMAIAAGIADGLGFGANSRAALITRGLAEIVRLGHALGGQSETFMGLAGMGDLVLTCTDNQSRNRRFGYALAKGKTHQQALDEIGQVVEGIHAAREVAHLAHKYHIEMPIVEQVNQVLKGDIQPIQAVENLLSRELKAESFSK